VLSGMLGRWLSGWLLGAFCGNLRVVCLLAQCCFFHCQL